MGRQNDMSMHHILLMMTAKAMLKQLLLWEDITNFSHKQQINAKNSTETELIGTYDVFSHVLWMR